MGVSTPSGGRGLRVRQGARLAGGENDGCLSHTAVIEGRHRTALLGVVYTTCTNAMGKTVDSMIWFRPAPDNRVHTCIDPGENATAPPPPKPMSTLNNPYR
jgi:hypothetical protein